LYDGSQWGKSRQVSRLPNVSSRFEPTCSDYTRQAVEKYGAMKGSWLGVKRILRCQPFSKGGYDPVK
jgi:putative membrane protein insertion efficiency factor